MTAAAVEAIGLEVPAACAIHEASQRVHAVPPTRAAAMLALLSDSADTLPELIANWRGCRLTDGECTNDRSVGSAYPASLVY